MLYQREKRTKKKIEYTNLQVHEDLKSLVGKPSTFTIDEFKMDNGDGGSDLSVAIERSTTSSTTKSESTTNSGGFGISVSYTKYMGMFGVSAGKVGGGVETTFNWSGSNSNSSTTSKTSSDVLTCVAPAGRFFKCQKESSTQKYDIPYSYTKKYTNYNGVDTLVRADGVISEMSSSSIIAKSCCYNMCETDDVLCDTKAKIGNTNPCSSDIPVKQTIAVDSKTYTLNDYGLDIKVVTDIKFVVGKTDVTCPSGYDKDTQDIRQGDGGNYVYFCIMSKKLSEITTGLTTINEIRIQYENKACGVLTLVQSLDTEPTNDLSDGKKIYLCAGNNPDSKSFAVSKIQVKTSVLASSTKDNETFETIPQNLGLDNGNQKYLYITRNKKAPRKILLKNYQIEKYERNEMVLPTQVDGITAIGSSVVKKISNTVSTEATKSSSFDFGVAVNFEVTAGSEDLGFELTVGIKANYNRSTESTSTDTSESSDSQEITCAAQPKKTVKCMITKGSQRIISHYTYDQEFVGYDGAVILLQKIKGTSESKESSSLSISTCCDSGCCEGDKTKDAGKTQCFDDKGEIRPKDFKCADYNLCLTSAKTAFDSSTPKDTVTLTTSIVTSRFFR